MCLFDLNINRTSSFAVVMNSTATRGRCLTKSIYVENSKSAFGKHFTFEGRKAKDWDLKTRAESIFAHKRWIRCAILNLNPAPHFSLL